MASNEPVSDAVVTRRGDVVPGDKQDNPGDGKTSTVSYSDPNKVDWGDALQHALLRMGGDLGRVGPLNSRPSPGEDTPVWYLVTDDEDGAYFSINTGSAWADVGALVPNSAVHARAAGGGEGVLIGDDAGETVANSTTPTGWVFEGSQTRDVHVKTTLELSNASGSDATEDVTVALYDGTSTSGTKLLEETRSITVTAGAAEQAEEFIATEQVLDAGDYYLDVTTSGTALSVDNAIEATAGALYRLAQSGDGSLQITDDRSGDVLWAIDAATGNVSTGGSSGVAEASRSAPNLNVSVQLEAGTGTSNDDDHYHAPIHVPDGKTLNVYGVGVAEGDGSAPPADLQAELNTAAKNTVSGTSPVSSRWTPGDPLWTVSNSSGSTQVFFISVDNGTTTAYVEGESVPFVTLTAAYRVE